MRDPYDPWADEQAHLAELAQAQDLDAIRSCTHCDHQGIRPNGLTCRHIDHAAAAKRGLATIRAQMGWNTPTGTTTPQTSQKPPHDATSSQKTRL
ncbi:Uncharacterised protein [Mycobacteroides abscessus subsp. massiliense]|uniref:hypothetical protein n=1 Tax=Mycobacteroides abscessus TaxID=36809 RepID=UPI000927ABF0|nr:hypothetical protein [Mycobacteroides abscessus]QSM02769.1 hypothetical protein PROPHIGD88-1_33 [Mycobacterium phage prophi88-1]QSM03317.1 hypothetical protein PROPHIGD43A-6_33 [Mycobacterium phage prophi43-6]MBN7559810.1 hypothetical protein [Mycobacteroides abscessus subsp. abscessus]QSN24863.1 hypothetical protein I3U36_18650 [Mycobacteroides abscessus subsp. abscessus]QSN30065.1 hypothetical protein I3U42_18940 [Mycobacteroides abscessus subsp. abscessus]